VHVCAFVHMCVCVCVCVCVGVGVGVGVLVYCVYIYCIHVSSFAVVPFFFQRPIKMIYAAGIGCSLI